MEKIFTDIVFVRHGETTGNTEGLLQGQGNSHLSPTGILQVQAAAEELAETPFTAAWSSDLVRAVETAGILLEKHPGIKLHPTPELREWNLGIYEGRKQVELLRDYPEEMAKFRFMRDDFQVPEGESRTQFQQRISGCLNRIIEENPGGCILIVSHGWAAHRILAHFYGDPKQGMILPVPNNTGISRFRWSYADQSCQLICWNDTGHLKGLPKRVNPIDR